MITYDIASVFQMVLRFYHHMNRVQNFKMPLGWLAYGILLPSWEFSSSVELEMLLLTNQYWMEWHFGFRTSQVGINLVNHPIVSPLYTMKSPLHSHSIPSYSHHIDMIFPLKPSLYPSFPSPSADRHLSRRTCVPAGCATRTLQPCWVKRWAMAMGGLLTNGKPGENG